MPLKSRRLLLSLGLLATFARPAQADLAPDAAIQLQPRPATAERPAYCYYQKISETRQGPETYTFTVTMQGPFPEAFPENQGIKYRITALISEKVPDKPIPVITAGDLATFERKAGSTEFVSTAGDVQGRDGRWEVSIQNLTFTKDGFTFSIQCPAFANASSVKFLINSFLFADAPGQKSEDSSETPVTTSISLDPARPGLTIQPPLTPEQLAGPKPGPTPEPPGQVTWELSKSKSMRTTMGVSSFDPAWQKFGYRTVRKVVIKHLPDSLDFTVTLAGPLPDEFSKKEGIRYTFFFNFENTAAEDAPKNHPLSSRFSTLLNIAYVSGAKPFEWGGGDLVTDHRHLKITVASFTRTADGFTATFSSPIFQENFPATVRLGAELISGAPHAGQNTSSGAPLTDSITIPAETIPGPAPSIGHLLKP